MKIFLLSLVFLGVNTFCYADDESVCVLSTTASQGYVCTSSNLGLVDPCATLTFIVNKVIPLGYTFVKYEWFVNGVSLKTSTEASDYGFVRIIVAKPFAVFCEVTYRKQDGTLSSPYKSTTFTPMVKELNFSNITTSSSSPFYGCSGGTVSYTLNPYTCQSFCTTIYSPTQYSISWQPPAGWVQTSI